MNLPFLAFYIIFLGYRRNDKDFDIEKEGTIMYNVGETFIRMFIMSLTEFAVLFEQLELCDLNLIGRVSYLHFDSLKMTEILSY